MINFVAMFDDKGLDGLISWEPEELTMAALKGEEDVSDVKKRVGNAVSAMKLRARFNLHRRPFICALALKADMTEEEMYELCSKEPKMMGKLFKEKGEILFKTEL